MGYYEHDCGHGILFSQFLLELMGEKRNERLWDQQYFGCLGEEMSKCSIIFKAQMENLFEKREGSHFCDERARTNHYYDTMDSGTYYHDTIYLADMENWTK